MTQIPVSVVMSVYNAERFLDEAIDSIRQQTFTDFEFIIVDDGSTDGTSACLARHAEEDSRIRIVNHNGPNLVAALNQGLAAASGRLIARMDGDDIALPERFARQVKAFAETPDVAAIGTCYTLIDEKGAHLRDVSLPLHPAEIRTTLAFICCLAQPTVMMRRDMLMAAGGYRRAFVHCEDYDLWLRLSELGDLRNLPERCLLYRDFASKHTAAFTEQQTLSELGARASSERRHQGLPDPADEAPVITAGVLAQLGVPARIIHFEVARRALQAARRARRIGDYGLAHDLIGLASRQQMHGPWEHFRYAMMRLKVMI